MPILITQPIEIPAKTLTKMWAREIIISAPTPRGDASASVNLVPFNDAGDFSYEAAQQLRIPSIMAKVLAAPTGKMAKAYAALLEAIDEEYQAQVGNV